MAQHEENKTISNAVELLKTNGFDGLGEAVTMLLNSAMVAERSGRQTPSYSDPLDAEKARDFPGSGDRALRRRRAGPLEVAALGAAALSVPPHQLPH